MNIFNPEHDLCMANGDANFVPPASALEFGKDCAGLTRWIDQSSENEVIPWGWDAVLKRRLQKEGAPGSMLPSDDAIAEIRRLSHRGNAVNASIYVNDFQANADVRLLKHLRPLSYVREISDVNALAPAVEEFGDAVLKAPLSGSGKGLRWARRNELSASDLGWSRNVIAKQGSLMVEKRLEIVQDFAMLFHVGRSEVSSEGYSLFFNDNGIYKGNAGYGVDMDKAIETWTQGIPNSRCLFELGKCYYWGNGVQKDKDLAYNYFLRVSDQGKDFADKYLSPDKSTLRSEEEVEALR